MEGLKYCGTVELQRKDNGEFESFAIYIDSENRIYPVYPDGQEIDMGQLQRDYKDLNPIRDIVNKAKEMEDKEEELEPEDRTNSLDELEQDSKEEEKEEQEEQEEFLGEEKVEDLQISNAQGKVDLDQMVNGQTLRNILGLEADYTYIAPVSSSSVGLEGSNAKYTFVALKNDNTAKILHDDVIHEDRQEGINSADKDNFIGNDGKVEQKSSVSNYIVGNGKYSLAIYHDEGTSSMSTTITRRSGRENTNGEIDKELHHQGDKKIDSDSRDSLRERNGIGESDAMKERQENHKNKECENSRVENIDDDKTNDDHFHITDEQLKELAEKTGENKDKLRERFERESQKNPGKNSEQIIEEIESDYEMLRSHNYEQ